MTVEPYPLIFRPIFKPKIWGGRRLQSRLTKALSSHEPFGESWEIVDLPADQSTVAVGPLAGKSLAEVCNLWGTELYGRAQLVEGRFPLLIKFIDATETLSVQVHPDADAVARLVEPGASHASNAGAIRIAPKHEAWYIIDAEPEAVIYRGLLPGTSRKQLENALADSRIESLLQKVPARKGHCYYSPAGTVHAIGAGVLCAEVQTPSDTTFRLYDWGRVDPGTGTPRELHLSQALSCIRYEPVSPEAERPEHLASLWTSISSLVRCEHFVIERVRLVEGMEQEIPHQEMVIWIVLEGSGTILHGRSASTDFSLGNTVLIPAGLKQGRVQAKTRCMWLEVTVPIPSSLTGYERLPRRLLSEPMDARERFVYLRLPPKP